MPINTSRAAGGASSAADSHYASRKAAAVVAGDPSNPEAGRAIRSGGIRPTG